MSSYVFATISLQRLVIQRQSLYRPWPIDCFLHYARIRDLISSSFETTSEKIGRDGIIVEIDESKFGKVKHHRGHRVEGVSVAGGVKKHQIEQYLFRL